MNNIKSLPSILQKLVQAIEDYLDKTFPNRKKTLPIKMKRRSQNTIISWNIYPEPQKEVSTLFITLQQIISSILEQTLDGELIYYELKKGHIFDAGIKAFSINHGFIWDLYLYQPEIFVYIRLIHECNLDNSNEWISIDIDLIESSAWFLD